VETFSPTDKGVLAVVGRTLAAWTPALGGIMMCATPDYGRAGYGPCGLAALGLGKYEAVFRENEIDETVLPNLTAEDLKELGVTALGHRCKLQDTIAALRTYANAQAPSPAVAVARVSVGPRTEVQNGGRWRAAAYHRHVLRPSSSSSANRVWGNPA
jgi:hypothetical protein